MRTPVRLGEWKREEEGGGQSSATKAKDGELTRVESRERKTSLFRSLVGPGDEETGSQSAASGSGEDGLNGELAHVAETESSQASAASVEFIVEGVLFGTPTATMLTFVFVIAYLAAFVQCSALTTMIQPNVRACFYADVDKPGEKIGVRRV